MPELGFHLCYGEKHFIAGRNFRRACLLPD
jgi:hypothetical protein